MEYITTQQVCDDELSTCTEVISRQVPLPTPIELPFVSPLGTNKSHNIDSNDDSIGKPYLRYISPHQHIQNSIHAKITKSNQSNNLGSLSGKPQRCKSVNDRILSVTSKLSDCGIIPDTTTLNHDEIRNQENNNSATHDKPYYWHFIHLLHSLDSNQNENINSTNNISLNSLLVVLENLLEELYHTKQESIYWKNQVETLRNGTQSNQSYQSSIVDQHEITQTSSFESKNDVDSYDPVATSRQNHALKNENEYLKTTLRDLGYAHILYPSENDNESHISAISTFSSTASVSQMHKENITNSCCTKLATILQRQISSLQVDNKSLHNTIQEMDIYRLSLESRLEKILISNEHDSNAVYELRQKESALYESLSHKEAECERLQSSTQKLQIECLQVEQSNQILEDNVSKLTHEIESLQAQGRGLSIENANLRSQINDLSEQLQVETQNVTVLERRINECEKNKEQIISNLRSSIEERARIEKDLQEVSFQTEALKHNQAIELQRMESKARNDANVYREKALQLEKECVSLRQSLAKKHECTEQLQELLTMSQSREAAASDQIRKLGKEKCEMLTKLNVANARLDKFKENGCSTPSVVKKFDRMGLSFPFSSSTKVQDQVEINSECRTRLQNEHNENINKFSNQDDLSILSLDTEQNCTSLLDYLSPDEA